MSHIDSFILKALEEDRLRVCLQTLRVWYYHSKRKTWHEKVPDFHPVSGRARFRFDTDKVKRATVYRNRLVYMAANRVAPERVDHKDTDRLNDLPENLQAHTTYESNKQGYDIQVAKQIEIIGNWFDWVAYYGVYPPDDYVAEIPL